MLDGFAQHPENYVGLTTKPGDPADADLFTFPVKTGPAGGSGIHAQIWAREKDCSRRSPLTRFRICIDTSQDHHELILIFVHLQFT